jgi:MFS family permease
LQETTHKKITAPLHHRDLRYLVAGLAVSQTGDWLYNVALLVFVLQRTGSPAWVAAAGIVRLIPYVVFGPIGGVIADRYPRKRVMVYSDLIRAVIMVGLVVVTAAASEHSIGAAFITILLAGFATTFAVAYLPSVNAAMPVIVNEDELSAANSILSTVANVCIFIGPAIGGVLLLLGSPSVAFAFNAVTFCLSAVFVSQIKGDLGPLKAEVETEGAAGDEAPPNFMEHLKGGIGAITTSKDVLVLVGAWAADAFLYGMEIVLFTLIATELLKVGDQGISFLYAGVGIGGLAAAVLANRAANRPRQGALVGIATAVAGLSLVAYAAVTVPFVGYTLAAIDGAATIVLDVLIVTSLQRMLGNEMLGRAFGAIDALVVAGMVLGSLVAPILVSLVDVKATLVIGGGFVVAVGLIVLQRARGIDRAAAERAQRLAPRVDLLIGLNIFEGASRVTLEALAAEISDEHVEAGTVVIHEGAEPDDLFVVVSGHTVVTAEGRGVVGELDAGDYFGEIGLLKRIPRTATVTASTACELYRIPGEEFLRLVNEGGAQTSSLFQNLQSRLAVTRPAQREEAEG